MVNDVRYTIYDWYYEASNTLTLSIIHYMLYAVYAKLYDMNYTYAVHNVQCSRTSITNKTQCTTFPIECNIYAVYCMSK